MLTQLPYSLHTRYKSIALAWTIIIIPPTFLNIGLFYILWYKTGLDRILVLTIPTAILGVFTVLAIIERVYKLTLRESTYRPLNSPRYALDVFQWGYFLSLLLISALISITLARGDIDDDNHELQTRLVSLPPALLMFILATLTLLSSILHELNVKISFLPTSGTPLVKPAVYYIVEDVVAIDGAGGMKFRSAWTARYSESTIFRKLILELSIVWMIAFYILSLGFTMAIFWMPVEGVYAVGWAGPFIPAGVMAVWTVYYVRAMLEGEKMGVAGEVEEGLVEEAGLVGDVDVVGEETALLGGRS